MLSASLEYPPFEVIRVHSSSRVAHHGAVATSPPPRLSPRPPLSSRTHYTDAPSGLSTTTRAAYVRVSGGGFVTREMLEQALEAMRATPQPWRPAAILVDLSDMAGYEASCLAPAHQFLLEATRLGVARIALVTSSSVIRRASQLAAAPLPLEFEAFEHEPSAKRWLVPDRPASGPIPMALHHPGLSLTRGPTAR